jgi:hypothetical protein
LSLVLFDAVICLRRLLGLRCCGFGLVFLVIRLLFVLLYLLFALPCWPFLAFFFVCVCDFSAVCFWALAFPCIVVGLLELPLCGAALTFFAAAKKVSKESGSHRQPVAVSLAGEPALVRDETRPRTTHFSDKALIRSSVALRAPPYGITPHTSDLAFHSLKLIS